MRLSLKPTLFQRLDLVGSETVAVTRSFRDCRSQHGDLVRCAIKTRRPFSHSAGRPSWHRVGGQPLAVLPCLLNLTEGILVIGYGNRSLVLLVGLA